MSVSLTDWTYEKYRELPDDGNRYEVLDGKLYVTPAPSSYHQKVSRRIQFLFYELERAGQGEVYNAPVDLIVSGAQPAQPDLVYLTNEQLKFLTRRGIEGPPALVVEILSPSTARTDRIDKLKLYQKVGVRHYLLVDVHAHTIEILLLDGATYRVVASLGPSDEFTLEPYSVTFVVDELFEGIPVE